MTRAELAQALRSYSPPPGPAQQQHRNGTVAFPQPTELSPELLRSFTSLSASLIFASVSATVDPSLWLVSALLGSLWGYTLSPPCSQPHETLVTNVASLLANRYISLRDFVKSFWFMYRTGQLSYAYFKRYESLDARFKIQDKVDAWNRRFREVRGGERIPNKRRLPSICCEQRHEGEKGRGRGFLREVD